MNALSSQIREGDKGIFEVLNWYNDIVNFVLNYLSQSIHDSDVADFYRYIIGFKNLLRSVEFSAKSGIYALRYFSRGEIEREHHHDFIRFEMLRKEYLNQTFNFLPDLRAGYDKAAKNQYYEYAQASNGPHYRLHKTQQRFTRTIKLIKSHLFMQQVPCCIVLKCVPRAKVNGDLPLHPSDRLD